MDSAKALEEILEKQPVFENFKVVSVAGDGRLDQSPEFAEDVEQKDGRNNSLERVRKAIKKKDKTITLTVGQLTTGVAVPEWSAVFMLSNVKSPALYMQAGFRSQNPHIWIETNAKGKNITYRKRNAYIFDFAPERSLEIIDDFANNLSRTTSESKGTVEERE